MVVTLAADQSGPCPVPAADVAAGGAGHARMPRVLDWTADRFEVGGPHVAGGVSMGGDVALVLAGTDDRIALVSALVATPDWTRPGMHRWRTSRG